MRVRPFVKLFVSLAVFVTVSCVLAEFRHGLSLPALFGALVGTLVSSACLDQFIWPHRSGESGRIALFLDFVIAGCFTAYAFLAAFEIPTSHWILAFVFVGCLLRGFCWWRGRRRPDTKALQARLLQKHHDRAA